MSEPVADIHVIACGVLAREVRAAGERLGLRVTTEFLPGRLHETPHELRRRVQEAIDRASASGECGRIAIGYGLCGMGTAGLVARAVPLVIPRVQDCIALLLGSDAAYREQFANYPGTYYVSAGWVEDKSPAAGERPVPREDERFEDLVARHGRENAEAIRHFLDSWKRNYQRAVYIDTPGAGGRRYADIARAMADEFGWKYEELTGTHALLHQWLTAEESGDEVLFVPPGCRTLYDPVAKGLTAAPESVEAEPRSDLLVFDEPGEKPAGEPVRLGLGIDAGGTYTDVVVYDFAERRVAGKAKALTTKWNYAEGITAALSQLDAGLLSRVELVSVSTTLATNAIVEGRGQKVGLLVMPPYGLFDPADIDHRPVAVLDGRMEIDGTETAPINPSQVRSAAREMVERQQVGAFAVAGFAGHVNPAHEQAVRAILRERTGLSVTCGHEVSDEVNYRVRAATSALNARIIPCLEQLLDRVGEALGERGIVAPVLVVRSDGSLMNVKTARERPIETILSGPAASVAGAAYLSGERDAVVVDIGGTTTDTGVIEGGLVRTCERGASVGGWRTHVKALDMRTRGLGGDSAVAWHNGRLHVGPRRVAPLAWLGTVQPAATAALSWIAGHLDHFGGSTLAMPVLAATGRQPPFEPTDSERAILEALSIRPASLHELAHRLESVSWEFLPLGRLEEEHVVQRCGLTPTDLLHVTGELSLWDAEASRRAAEWVCRLAGLEPAALARRVVDHVARTLATEVLAARLAATADNGEAEVPEGPLVANWLTGGEDALRVRVQLGRPLIGIGAPVRFFLPPAAERLETRAVIPPDAEVANAVGAITSSVSVRRQVTISPTESGQYAVQGVAGAPTFARLAAAHQYAVERLVAGVREDARRAGTSDGRVEVAVHDRMAAAADGTEIFLGRVLEGRLTGRPDAARRNSA